MARKSKLYVPSPTVSTFTDVEREFRRVEESFDEASLRIATEVSTAAPQKTFNLQVRYADGVNWNPRGLGAGLYIFVDNVWRKFTLT